MDEIWRLVTNMDMYLWRGVPVQRRPLQDEPETLPLLREENAAFFPLLPQPAVAVGPAKLATGDAASTQGRRRSCHDKQPKS